MVTIGGQEFVKYCIANRMYRSASRRNGSKDAGFISPGGSIAENGADHHLAEMCVLPLADSIHSAALADETPHRRVFMPNISELNFSDLPKSVMRARSLKKGKKSKLAHELASGGGAQNVEG